MAQNTFIPDGSQTHLDARNIWNGNATDAEFRISGLEYKSMQNVISSSSSDLTLDCNDGCNAVTTLTEDVTGFNIINSETGDSGLILIEQNDVGGWVFSSLDTVLGGDLADITSITPSGLGVGAIGWYSDGTDQYLFVSDVT